MKTTIINHIEKSIEIKQAILINNQLIDNIHQSAEMIIDAYKKKRKTILAGNGGSAADAQHIAGEFVSRLYFDRPGLPSLSLSTDTSILTAIGNDYGFDRLFARQIQANGNIGDVFIGISTSGNSANILEALKECKIRGIKTIGLTGQTGGRMMDLCDICLNIPSTETPRIQESHIMIGHILCSLVEEIIFAEYKPLN
jgi:D-sedoheptulose 7-phosphate isomerase